MGSSGITFSGFNKVDFNLILDAVMEQERAPLRSLETRKRSLETQQGHFRTFSAKVAPLQSAADELSKGDAFGGRSAANTDTTAVTISTSSSSTLGTYDIVITELARAQVTGSTSAHTDKDTTAVATGGNLIIGGVTVPVTASVTLQGLADAINSTNNIGVTATVVTPSSGTYQLVLTGKNTGTANAFAITNNLTGGAGVTFGANAVAATNAALTVNNITVSSASNTVTDAVPGATLTLLKKDPATTVTVTINQDNATTKASVKKFVTAFNDFVRFADEQAVAARNGTTSSIGRDSLLSGLRNTLRSNFNASYAVGGYYSYLAEVGLGFSSTGQMTFDETKYDAAAVSRLDDIKKLFNGVTGTTGAFGAVEDAIIDYTQAGGMLPGAQERLTTQVSTLSTQISDLEKRLAARRAALQKEYIAADMTMSRLNAQIQQLSALGSGLRF